MTKLPSVQTIAVYVALVGSFYAASRGVGLAPKQIAIIAVMSVAYMVAVVVVGRLRPPAVETETPETLAPEPERSTPALAYAIEGELLDVEEPPASGRGWVHSAWHRQPIVEAELVPVAAEIDRKNLN